MVSQAPAERASPKLASGHFVQLLHSGLHSASTKCWPCVCSVQLSVATQHRMKGRSMQDWARKLGAEGQKANHGLKQGGGLLSLVTGGPLWVPTANCGFNSDDGKAIGMRVTAPPRFTHEGNGLVCRHAAHGGDLGGGTRRLRRSVTWGPLRCRHTPVEARPAGGAGAACTGWVAQGAGGAGGSL